MQTLINYALFENKLTSDPNDYVAQIQTTGTIGDEELIDDMTSRGSTLTRAEAKSFIEEYFLSIKKSLLAGYTINTSLFNIHPSILGVFDGKDDSFDPARHTVRVNVTPGVKLRNIERDFKPVKTEALKPMPSLLDYKDIASGHINQIITPGGVGHITGNRLNFDEADQIQGIFLIASDNVTTRVTTMVRHKPSELIFMIPSNIKQGNYHIEVRVIFRGTKELRVGRLMNELVIM